MAQEQQKKGSKTGSVSGDFEVVRSYKPLLAEAAKVREDPEFTATKIYFPRMQYELPDKKVETPPYVDPLPQMKYNHTTQTYTIQNNMINILGGNMGGLKGELAFNTGKSLKNTNIGLYSRGNKRDESANYPQYHNYLSSLYSTYNNNYITLRSQLNFNSQENSFLGVNENLSQNTNKDSQWWKKIEGVVGISNPIDPSSGVMNYNAKVSYYILDGKKDLNEKGLKISGWLNKILDNKFEGKIHLCYERYDNKFLKLDQITTANITKQNFSNITIQPQLIYSINKTKLTGGITLINHNRFENDSQTHMFKGYPFAKIELPLAKLPAKLYANISGNYRINTIQDMLAQNPFIYKTDTLKASNEKLTFNAGSIGTLFPNVTFIVDFAYRFVQDLQTYMLTSIVTPNASTPYFKTYYIDGYTKILDAKMELHGDFNRQLYFLISMTYHQYTTPSIENPWFLPNITSIASLKYYSKKGYYIGSTLNTIGSADIALQGVDKKITSKKSDPFLNLGLNIGYDAFGSLRLFVNIDNLLNQQYNQFLVSPKYTTMYYGGIGIIF